METLKIQRKVSCLRCMSYNREHHHSIHKHSTHNKHWEYINSTTKLPNAECLQHFTTHSLLLPCAVARHQSVLPPPSFVCRTYVWEHIVRNSIPIDTIPSMPHHPFRYTFESTAWMCTVNYYILLLSLSFSAAMPTLHKHWIGIVCFLFRTRSHHRRNISSLNWREKKCSWDNDFRQNIFTANNRKTKKLLISSEFTNQKIGKFPMRTAYAMSIANSVRCHNHDIDLRKYSSLMKRCHDDDVD